MEQQIPPNEAEARQEEQTPVQPATNEAPVGPPAAGVWNFGASVNPPLRAAPPPPSPQDVIARLTATAAARALVAAMRDYDVFILRCRRDPGSDAPSLSLVEVKLSLALPHPPMVIPLSLAMARALPHCGVLTAVGYLSLQSRDQVPNDGSLWDPELLQAVPVS